MISTETELRIKVEMLERKLGILTNMLIQEGVSENAIKLALADSDEIYQVYDRILKHNKEAVNARKETNGNW